MKEWTSEASRGGQRLWTALVYLNDGFEGGETHFPRLDYSVKPRLGRLLVFQNTYRGSDIKHDLAEHAALPVISGEKYAFNLWFRERKFR